jgi:hypothetical protein
MGNRKKTDLERIQAQVWINSLLKKLGVSSVGKIDDVLGIEADKNWNRYKQGERCPHKDTLDLVEGKEKGQGSRKLFTLGPCRIFEILTVVSIQDAVEVIHEVIDDFCNEAGLVITETDYCLESPGLAVWLQGLATDLFNHRKYYGFGEEIIPLVLAVAHTENRFLGFNYSLARVADYALDFFEREYGVYRKYWESDPLIQAALHQAQVQKALQNLMKSSSSDQNPSSLPEDALNHFIESGRTLEDQLSEVCTPDQVWAFSAQFQHLLKGRYFKNEAALKDPEKEKQ